MKVLICILIVVISACVIIAGVSAYERDKDSEQQLKLQERREVDAYRIKREAGIFGN